MDAAGIEATAGAWRPHAGDDRLVILGQWTSDLPWNADNEAALADWGRRLAADIHDGT